MTTLAPTRPPARKPAKPGADAGWIRSRLRRLPRPYRLATHVVLLVMCGLIALPIAALAISSVRDPYAITTTGWWTVARDQLLTLRNYQVIFFERGMGRALLNSFLITVPSVVMITSIGAVSSYALARLTFPGRRLVSGLLLALLVVPVQMTLVPILRLFNALDLTGTYAGIWLAHTGFALPFAVYLMRNFFSALPAEVFEAAELDGATERQIFVKVALPLARPALASVAIFQFIWLWNDLLISLIFLGGSSEVAPVTVAIANLVNATTGQGWELLTAAAIVAMGVPLVVFLSLQRYFVRGLLAGAVK